MRRSAPAYRLGEEINLYQRCVDQAVGKRSSQLALPARERAEEKGEAEAERLELWRAVDRGVVMPSLRARLDDEAGCADSTKTLPLSRIAACSRK